MNVPSEYTIAVEQFRRMSISHLPTSHIGKQADRYSALWDRCLAEYVVMVNTDDMWTPKELAEFSGVLMVIGRAADELRVEARVRELL